MSRAAARADQPAKQPGQRVDRPASGPADRFAAREAADPPDGQPAGLFTERTPRVVAARRLTRRVGRDRAGMFLAEGPQAVRSAIAERPDAVTEVFFTHTALDRHADLVAGARDVDLPVSVITDQAAAGLSETTTPQGVVAVCRFVDVPLGSVADPRLVAVLAAVADPGNAGTVLRTADAAGADAVVYSARSVDPYNGKAVRASAGSLFHLPVVRGAEVAEAVAGARAAGLAVLAADGAGEADLDELDAAGALAGPTAWLFGNEAHGLAGDVAALADTRVRIPIHGRAESLNLAAAAAVCLYASARAQRATRSRKLPGPAG